MKRLSFFLLIISFLPSAQAEEGQKCNLDKYKAYSLAQEKWQRESTEIIKKTKPEFAEAAELYKKDQLVLIEKQRVAVEQMLSLKPDRVQTSFPPNRWIQLTNEDIKFLRQSSKKYVELSKQVESNQKRPPHPDGDALREAMRMEIINSPEFKESFSKFMASVGKIEDRVCQ